MSLLQQLLDQVGSLTRRLNDIENAAKTNAELPIQNPLQLASTIRAFYNGNSETITVQNIIDKSMSLLQPFMNRFVSTTGFILSEQDLIINANWTWYINGSIYTNPNPITINIPFSEEGMNRIDLIAANVAGNFVRIPGVESNGIPVAPELPANMLQATFLTITDGTISEPEQPSVPSNYIYVTKSELDILIAASELKPGSTYVISGCDINLYGGTTLYLEAITKNKVSENGIGKFFIPDYDEVSIVLNHRGIWRSNYEEFQGMPYAVDDLVIWGGKIWKNVSGFLGYAYDIYELSAEDWEAFSFDETSYLVTYDSIRYNCENDIIFSRKFETVSVTYDIAEFYGGDNPIKCVQWRKYKRGFEGSIYYSRGGYNVEIVNSLFENLNWEFLCRNIFLSGAYVKSSEYEWLTPNYIINLTIKNIQTFFYIGKEEDPGLLNNQIFMPGMASEITKTSELINDGDSVSPFVTADEINEKLSRKAELIDGMVPWYQLPTYIDDIIEGIYVSPTIFTVDGSAITLETGKVYVNTVDNRQYRFTGSSLIAITNGFIASTNDVPEGANLYYTDARVLAAVATANIYQATLTGDIFGNFITGLIAKPAIDNADEFSFSDKANGNKQKKLTWLNIKNSLRTFFEDIFQIKGVYEEYFIFNTTPTTPVTGITTQTIYYSEKIKAGTLKVGSQFTVGFQLLKSGVVAGSALNAYVGNASDALVFSKIIGSFNRTSTNQMQPFERTYEVISPTKIRLMQWNNSGANDKNQAVASWEDRDFDISIDQWIIATGTLTSAADTMFGNYMTIKGVK